VSYEVFGSVTRYQSVRRCNRRRLQYSIVATWSDQRCLKSRYDQTSQNDLWPFVTAKVCGYNRSRRNTKIL